jgi:hypothetical protein
MAVTRTNFKRIMALVATLEYELASFCHAHIFWQFENQFLKSASSLFSFSLPGKNGQFKLRFQQIQYEQQQTHMVPAGYTSNIEQSPRTFFDQGLIAAE